MAITKHTNLIIDRKNKYYNNGKPRLTTDRQKDGTLVRKYFTDREKGVRFNIWRYGCGYMKSSKDKISFKHPAIFPEDLARDHILSWSNLGDIVLDPMCGSGTTCKMAKQYNRKYIGIDLGYKEISEERLRQEVFPNLIK